MGRLLDTVPFSGIIRIRDMMYGVESPYRLDQGDVSFDVSPAVKEGMVRALAENRTHYVQTTGVPRLLEAIAHKLRSRNGIPVEGPDEVMVTNGGIHGLYIACQALLEPGDEVIVPDPRWPPTIGNVLSAGGVPVGCPLHEPLGWRWDLDELESKITPRTRALYVNSPHNPTGGVLARPDIDRIAALARDRDLWILSDEAYEDIVYDAAEHVSPASRPAMYGRTIPIYTLSKSYAMTGLRLGYLAVADRLVRERARKVLFHTASNVASIVQYGALAGLEGGRAPVEALRHELQARRDLFYEGLRGLAGGVLSGAPPRGAFYAFLKISPGWAAPGPARRDSLSWAMAEYLIGQGRIGCVPGADFGPHGEGYVRFCFARDRHELAGALQSMRSLFKGTGS